MPPKTQQKQKEQEKRSSDEFNPDQYVRDKVTREEILDMKRCFDAFDEDGNGYIDIEEMRKAIVESGMPKQSERLLKMMETCDGNGDSVLQFEEFLDFMGVYDKFNIVIEDKKLTELFNLASEGRDVITVDDFRRLKKELHEHYADYELVDMIQAADLDKDGLINEEEFINVITKDYRNNYA